MPRNPNKRRIQTPGCNAWAMRSLPGSVKSKPGQSTIDPSRSFAPAQAGGTPAQAGGTPANHCRSHMDHILGPHRVGAPKRNLNALKTGRYAHPLSKENLELTAHAVAQNPLQIAEILYGHIDLINSRTADAYLTLLLVARITEQLLPLVADHRFHLELSDFLKTIPPASRLSMETTIWKHALPFNPLDRLTLIRGIINGQPPKNNQRESNP